MKSSTEEEAGSQWPRFEVFLQDRPGRPHKNVGSVHAPDADIALQNARDVFVRRPYAHNLWVAPVGVILARTEEELDDAAGWGEAPAPEGAAAERYTVFQKQGQRQSMTYVVYAGEVEALSAEQALRRATVKFGGGQETFVWWVCPERALVRSQEEDIDSMFAPAEQKTYRLPREYHTLTMIREAKARKSQREAREAGSQ